MHNTIIIVNLCTTCAHHTPECGHALAQPTCTCRNRITGSKHSYDIHRALGFDITSPTLLESLRVISNRYATQMLAPHIMTPEPVNIFTYFFESGIRGLHHYGAERTQYCTDWTRWHSIITYVSWQGLCLSGHPDKVSSRIFCQGSKFSPYKKRWTWPNRCDFMREWSKS